MNPPPHASASLRGPGRLCRRRRGLACLRDAGFTFLEMVAVLLILATIFAMTAPKLDILPQKYRLRAAARMLGTKIEEVRLAAVSRGQWLGIYYYLDGEKSYWQIVPPPPEDYPDQPVEDRPRLAKKTLPPGVSLVRVRLRGASNPVEAGGLFVLFSPAGTTGSHAVTFSSRDGRYLTLEFNAITGTTDFYESEDAVLADFED